MGTGWDDSRRVGDTALGVWHRARSKPRLSLLAWKDLDKRLLKDYNNTSFKSSSPALLTWRGTFNINRSNSPRIPRCNLWDCELRFPPPELTLIAGVQTLKIFLSSYESYYSSWENVKWKEDTQRAQSHCLLQSQVHSFALDRKFLEREKEDWIWLACSFVFPLA